jgi:hypothetical protein
VISERCHSEKIQKFQAIQRLGESFSCPGHFSDLNHLLQYHAIIYVELLSVFVVLGYGICVKLSVSDLNHLLQYATICLVVVNVVAVVLGLWNCQASSC